MKREDLSALLTQLVQKLTEGDGVDVRHDRFYSRKEVADLLSISRQTLEKAIRTNEFPPPVQIAGQDRWSSSVINEFIRQTNPQLSEQEELQQQAARFLGRSA